MQASVDHLLTQARERFEMQDYYGSVHLLQEIVDSGRSFADVFHLMGLAFSLSRRPPHEFLIEGSLREANLTRRATGKAATPRAKPTSLRWAGLRSGVESSDIRRRRTENRGRNNEARRRVNH